MNLGTFLILISYKIRLSLWKALGVILLLGRGTGDAEDVFQAGKNPVNWVTDELWIVAN